MRLWEMGIDMSDHHFFCVFCVCVLKKGKNALCLETGRTIHLNHFLDKSVHEDDTTSVLNYCNSIAC